MNIVVYCSSKDDLDEPYQQLAAELGRWIGQNGHTLVYGGVKAGLMHITAQAVHDAGGGRVMGVIPQMFLHRADPLCDELLTTDGLGERKERMIEMGDVFVVLPGGIGTLDEWISTLCVLAVGDTDARGIILADIGEMFGDTISQLGVLQRSPFARGKDLERTVVAGSTEQLIKELDKIANAI